MECASSVGVEGADHLAATAAPPFHPSRRRSVEPPLPPTRPPRPLLPFPDLAAAGSRPSLARIRRGPGRHGRAAPRANPRTAPPARAGRHSRAAPRLVPLPGRLLIGASMTRLDAMAAPRLIPLPGRLLHFPRRRQEELF
jgi:hypothetical protein